MFGYEKDKADRKDLKAWRLDQMKQEKAELNKTKEILKFVEQQTKSLSAIKEHIGQLEKIYGNLENAVEHLQTRLAAEIDLAFQDVVNSMQFIEYRKKRDSLIALEHMVNRSLTYAEYTSLKDLSEECRQNRPENFLIWSHNRVVTTRIKPSLLSSILDIVTAYHEYLDWMSIIVGDAVRAMGYQMICLAINAEQQNAAVVKHDFQSAKKKIEEIEKMTDSIKYDVFNKIAATNSRVYQIAE